MHYPALVDAVMCGSGCGRGEVCRGRAGVGECIAIQFEGNVATFCQSATQRLEALF